MKIVVKHWRGNKSVIHPKRWEDGWNIAWRYYKKRKILETIVSVGDWMVS